MHAGYPSWGTTLPGCEQTVRSTEDAISGVPIKAPFEEQVRKWKAKFQCN